MIYSKNEYSVFEIVKRDKKKHLANSDITSYTADTKGSVLMSLVYAEVARCICSKHPLSLGT